MSIFSVLPDILSAPAFAKLIGQWPEIAHSPGPGYIEAGVIILFIVILTSIGLLSRKDKDWDDAHFRKYENYEDNHQEK